MSSSPRFLCRMLRFIHCVIVAEVLEIGECWRQAGYGRSRSKEEETMKSRTERFLQPRTVKQEQEPHRWSRWRCGRLIHPYLDYWSSSISQLLVKYTGKETHPSLNCGPALHLVVSARGPWFVGPFLGGVYMFPQRLRGFSSGFFPQSKKLVTLNCPKVGVCVIMFLCVSFVMDQQLVQMMAAIFSSSSSQPS